MVVSRRVVVRSAVHAPNAIASRRLRKTAAECLFEETGEIFGERGRGVQFAPRLFVCIHTYLLYTSVMKKTWIIVGVIVVLVLWVLVSYNSLVKTSAAVDKQWSNVETDYQRRLDLIPNLVSTVKGSANFEQQTLTQVIEARAAATQVKLDADDLTPENLAKFQAAQNNVSGALGRLLAVAENYPQLKTTDQFLALQDQLEGTENRISVSRKDFNTAVLSYNTTARTFPTVIVAKLFGFDQKPYFEAAEGSENAPVVNFDTNTAPVTR